jgi:hypothetical protein
MLLRLDPESVGKFQYDGFLAFDIGLPGEETAALRAIPTDLISRETGLKEGALFDAMGIDDGTTPRRFTQILHPRVFAQRTALRNSSWARMSASRPISA